MNETDVFAVEPTTTEVPEVVIEEVAVPAVVEPANPKVPEAKEEAERQLVDYEPSPELIVEVPL